MARSNPLQEYEAKRDFESTPEPDSHSRGKRESGQPRFVVQKHAARNLHYDFRLEVDGVLKSWAVPKGPSMDPKVKRLAMEVEDHPLSYMLFEGVIPEHNYGAGEVIVWDRGTYEPSQETPMEQALEKGHATFRLNGDKLHGGFALTRTSGGAKPKWLLVKMRDDEARAEDIVKTKPKSVLSGRKIEQLKEKA